MKNSIAFIVWSVWACLWLGFWCWAEQRHHRRHNDEAGT